jgi:hypothetical protein
MTTFSAEKFHKLYGSKKQRINYQDKDFLDYAIMLLLCALASLGAYGAGHVLTLATFVLGAFMLATFPLRHGVKLKMPIILRRPQDVLYLVIHKIQNMKVAHLVAVAALLAENLFIYLTPNLPHRLELMHTVALYAFGIHLGLITAYRTVILVAHLYKRELVREILMQSVWRSSLEKQPSIALEIVHAFATGMMTHIVFLAPWFMVITYAKFSVLALPVTIVAAILIQKNFAKSVADWFYRDHWLGHNAEIDFVYLHGPHHDAIPSGLIAVAGNGYLEGYLRGLVGFPTPFLNPVMAALFYTIDVKIDIDSHQFIPGIYPKIPKEFYEVTQHSTHHFGRIEPYGFAINLGLPGISEDTKKMFKILPDELKYSIQQDEQLTGFEWDNNRHRWFLDLVDKYQGGQEAHKQPNDYLTGS